MIRKDKLSYAIGKNVLRGWNGALGVCRNENAYAVLLLIQMSGDGLVAPAAEGGQIINGLGTPNGRVAAVVDLKIFGAVAGATTIPVVLQRLFPKCPPPPSLEVRRVLVVWLHVTYAYAFVPLTRISGRKQIGSGFDWVWRSVPRSNLRGACLAYSGKPSVLAVSLKSAGAK